MRSKSASFASSKDGMHHEHRARSDLAARGGFVIVAD